MERKNKVLDVIRTLNFFPKSIKLIGTFGKKRFRIVIFLSFILGVVPSLSLLLSQQMINKIMMRESIQTVFFYLVIYVLVSMLSQYLSSYKTYQEMYIQNIVNYEMNCMIMEKSKKLSLSDYEDASIYDKMQRVQGEIGLKPYQTLQLLISIITTVATLISSTTILISWKPWSAVFLVVIPFFSSFYYFKLGQKEFEYKLKRTGESRKSWYLSKLLTMDSSIKEVKLFDLGEHFTAEYKKINQKFIDQDMSYMRKRTIFDLIHETIMHICSCVVVIASVIAAYSGEILIGNVVTYIKSISMVESSCAALLTGVYSIYNNSLYIKELFEFLDLKESEEEGRVQGREIKSIQNVEFKDVSFRYKQGRVALHHINLRINRAEKIAIVGLNGSGKTTFIKLLTGLYTVTDGEVLFNNVDIHNYSIRTIRQKISVLFQDFMKYEMTLRQNIGLGNISEMSCDNHLYDLLKRVRLKEVFQGGLETQLGLWFHDGVGLSGGQWQKLAIARAMIKEADIYILDEPSSALDPISINEIMSDFLRCISDKICIFITHKMSSVHYADRIILMKDGEICGDGSHEVLYRENEYYRQLYDKEMKEDER